MIHEMKLQPKYYNYIQTGTKCIELRLNDEKRNLVNIGDTIKFLKEPELIESMELEVKGLLKYDSFTSLFEDFSIEMLADASMTKEELLNVLEQFYTPEKQKQYSVVGFRLNK